MLDLLKLRNENPVIAYLNINSHREKNCKSARNMSLDAFYLNAQFHIEKYQFPPFRRDKNKHERGKLVFLRNGIIAKRLESLKGKES